MQIKKAPFPGLEPINLGIGLFRVGATFEMIRTEQREICISIDSDLGVAAPFKWKRERQGSRETERERVSVCASVGRHRDSVGQHPQTTR